MNKYVTDTQALVKYFEGKKVINDNIHKIFKMSEFGEALIIIPSPVIFEIGILNQKGRTEVSLKTLEYAFSVTDCLIEQKLDFDIIKTSFEIGDIPELHDRLIAGTARHLNLPILTNDPIILASKFIQFI